MFRRQRPRYAERREGKKPLQVSCCTQCSATWYYEHFVTVNGELGQVGRLEANAERREYSSVRASLGTIHYQHCAACIAQPDIYLGTSCGVTAASGYKFGKSLA